LLSIPIASYCSIKRLVLENLSSLKLITKLICLVLVQVYYETATLDKWQGHRLFAVDGSVTQLPISDELLNHFGKARSQASMPAVWFYKYHRLKNVDFCMHIVKSPNIIKVFLDSGEYSDIVDFPCTEKSLRWCRKDNISTESIRLRLVRVDLPSGESEVLVSSLTDLKAYPTSIFADLYHQRWGVEEDYKVLKSRLNIENFSSISVEGVLQDIHAKLLTKNITASSIHDAKQKL
jgi:hypothetical protein